MWQILVWLALGYIIGSVSFTRLYKRWYGVENNHLVSGTPTSALREIGLHAFIPLALLEVIKGIIVTTSAYAITHNEWMVVAAGIGVVTGHAWPIFFDFQGGKSLSAAFGGAITLMFIHPPLILLLGIALTIWMGVWLYTQLMSLGSILATLTILISGTVAYLIQLVPLPILVFAWVAALVILVRHRGNVIRLIQGTEHSTPLQ